MAKPRDARRTACLLLIGAASVTALAPAAQAATSTVGQSSFVPNEPCTNTTLFQTNVESGTSYTVQITGTIVSWSFHYGTATVLPGLKLKVFRLAAGPANTYKVIGESAAGTQVANTEGTYPASIPVQKGDVIGIYGGGSGGACNGSTGLIGDTISYKSGDFLVNSTETYTAGIPGYRIPVSAVVQPPPTISSLSPASGPPTGGTQTTIKGENFTGATAVNFGGATVAFNVNSDTQITTSSPAGPLGAVNVQVTTAAGQTTASGASQFTYATPVVVIQHTGKRAAALKKCRKKHGKAKRRCVRRAKKLPV